jgi:pilus assembly protein Flp/PilA
MPRSDSAAAGGENVRFLRRQSGQGMVEYALILVLVSIVVIVILLTMGGQIKNVFSNIVMALNA